MQRFAAKHVSNNHECVRSIANGNHQRLGTAGKYGSGPTKQRTRRKILGRKCMNTITKSRLLEWLSWLLAATSMAGIVIVLFKLDKHPLPKWPYGITLGASVSVLATVATIGLAEPISVGIGQAKWKWPVKENCMADFDLIDGASRGPLKAIWLICRGRGGYMGICGAILAVAVIGVNPFVQQVIKPSLDIFTIVDAAQVPIATSYTADESVQVNTDVYLSMKAALQRALLDINANASTFFVTPQCLTGNCTWQNYSLLAVCSRCASLSFVIEGVGNESTSDPSSDANSWPNTTSLPNGISLGSDWGTTVESFIAMMVNVSNGMSFNQLDTLVYSDWVNTKKAMYPLADVFTVVAPYAFDNKRADLQGPYASECLLQLCVQKFSSSSKSGVFSEWKVDNPVYINDTLGVLWQVAGTKYTVEWNTAKGLSSHFASIFSTTVHQQNGLSAISEWPEDGIAQSLFHWTNGSTDHLPSQLFDNIASSMTLNIRQSSNLTALSTSQTSQTIVIVRWEWMILPFVMLTLVALYLLAVLISTSRSHLERWKTSSLPILMHGLADDESRNAVRGLATLGEMENVADGLCMKMIRTNTINSSKGDHFGLSLTERTTCSNDVLELTNSTYGLTSRNGNLE